MAIAPDYVPNFEECCLPYVQWYQDDFIGGVRGMKADEIGIYTMLLMEMYARGAALDLPHDRLARMCGADKRTFERVLKQLVADGKIIKLACGYWNERCEHAFRSRAKMQQKNSAAALESWKNRSKNKEAQEHQQSDRKARAMPSSEAQNIEDKSSISSALRPAAATNTDDVSARETVEAEFAKTFWPVYPRKMDKKDALKAFVKARSAASLEAIMIGLRRYTAEMADKDPQFIRHAARWLNAESWNNGTESLSPETSSPDWPKRLRVARLKKAWPSKEWGPSPGAPGCLAPRELIQDGDGTGWKEWEQAA